MIDLSISNDLATVADGLETAWLVRQGSEPESEGQPIAQAWRCGIDTREAQPSHGQCTAADAVWRLPLDAIDEPPQPGDLLIDASQQRWTILTVRRLACATGWRVEARRLAIAARPDNRISILRAAYAKGADGAATVTWSTWRAEVAARIQPLEACPQPGTLGQTHSRVEVFIAADVAVEPTDRIEGPDGRLYGIRSIARAQRLGEPMRIEGEALS
jgi:hypothetical protein